MAEQLTIQQQQAVNDRGGRLLVSAAAGSGKTKVLVDRLLSYVMDPVDPANIDDFLLISYTKASAAELRGKIASKLSEKVAEYPDNRHLQSQLQRIYLTKISTVHAFCGDILREYAYRLNLPGDFRVADENECREIRESVLRILLEQAYEDPAQRPNFTAFVDSQGLGRDDRCIPEIVEQVYDSARCHLDPAKWLQRCMDMVSTEGVQDAAQTEHGWFLMQRLFLWLDPQIKALEEATALASEQAGGQKVAALLADTLLQLKTLRQSNSWDAVCRNKQVDFGRLTFPKQFDPIYQERIKTIRNGCKDEFPKQIRPFADPSAQVLADLRSCQRAVVGLVSLVEEFEELYTSAKLKRRVLDFGDLEHRMLDLLLGKHRSAPTAIAREIGERFREVMVDEYQDSNEVQDAIYSALTEQRQNLFMVGDVKQSIYQFRLADPGIFLQKYHAYVPAQEAMPGQGRKVLLSKNFRSDAGVLSACNDVFSLCMSARVGGLDYGPEEALYPGLPESDQPGARAQLYCIDVQEQTYAEEAAFVASHIHKLLDGNHYVREGDALRPIRPEDIAILLRSPGSSGAYFHAALDRMGIRYATGGGVDLLQTPEVATLRSLLQAIHNPLLDIPLIAAMASPLFGFTADDLAAIRSLDRNVAFYDTLRRSNHPKAVAFLRQLSGMREAMRFHSLTGLLEQILVSTRMEAVYAAMDAGSFRLANIQTFYQLACDFEASGNPDLGRFLEYLENMQVKGLTTAGDQSAPGCVTIMSIHKSKGLEFPVVFLCGLGREFNMEAKHANVVCHKNLGLGLSAVDHTKRLRYSTIAKRAIAAMIGQESISEELRVLYVAMTRAKERLIMTYASKRLQKDLNQIVQMINAGCTQQLIQDAVCPGDWILLTALHRTEAGALFALGGNCEASSVSLIPWEIRVETAPQLPEMTRQQTQTQTLPADLLQKLRTSLKFQYGYDAATRTPSKQTATQRKGRYQDEEAAENSPQPVKLPSWRRPTFLQQQSTGKEYGNAMHLAMQYLDYYNATQEDSIRQQLQNLVEQGFLTHAQGALVQPQKIVAFFSTELGRKILESSQVIREFKFSIMEDAGAYDPQVEDEQVLLQGVVDCALVEEDGITVIDFKTDYVTEENLGVVVDRYRNQVLAYKLAMERIYQKPVKQALLYFFHMDTFCQV